MSTTHSVVHLERKLKKPLMEKRRRARINRCLSELRTILMRNSPSHQRGKIEKADILEMTVTYLRQITCQQQVSPQRRRQSFVDGFTDCANSTLAYLSTAGPIQQHQMALSFGLMTHWSHTLDDKLQQFGSESMSAPTPPVFYHVNMPLTPVSPLSLNIPNMAKSSSDNSPSPIEVRCPTSLFKDLTCMANSDDGSGRSLLSQPDSMNTVWRPW
ncbi:Enhancer of split mgamma protein [Trichuris trichiura]|uniref:Enhancer of split mgamma protein n=1 Tax=Trichuris trichiura TaxID=36087 RepID=A0A077ZAY0_TRITR|nr:Enhancer of split mgamma protein [Trichuris trichiura]